MSRKQYDLTLVLAVVAGLIGGVVSSQLFMGTPVFAQKPQQQEKVIRAESFEVVDKDGKLRAMLGLGPNGEPSLVLYDTTLKHRAKLDLAEGSPALVFADIDGNPRAGLALLTDGSATLSFADREGKPHAQLILGADGEPSLQLFDKNVNSIWKVP